MFVILTPRQEALMVFLLSELLICLFCLTLLEMLQVSVVTRLSVQSFLSLYYSF